MARRVLSFRIAISFIIEDALSSIYIWWINGSADSVGTSFRSFTSICIYFKSFQPRACLRPLLVHLTVIQSSAPFEEHLIPLSVSCFLNGIIDLREVFCVGSALFFDCIFLLLKVPAVWCIRSVNFKFVPEPIFVSKQFAALLLITHLTLLAVFAHYKWCK